MLPKNSPHQFLIDAARHYAARVAGQSVERITLTLTDGSKQKIDVPSTGDWPPTSGWSVRGDKGARSGIVFDLTGKPLAVFAALVAAGAAGLSLAELKRAVWDEHTDDRTAQNTVSKLRQMIREGLWLTEEEEPVPVEGDRYRLAGG